MFRAIIYNSDLTINIVYPGEEDDWFDFQNGSYRLDRDAVCQVIAENDKMTDLVEVLYIRGNPLPLRSKMELKTVMMELLHDKMLEASTKPNRSFWSRIFGS